MNHATTRAALAALALALGSALPAYAHGDNHAHTPQHGGVVTEVGDMEYELVARPDRITLYLRAHGQLAKTDGASARLTLLSGSDKTEATLAPSGAGTLEAKGAFKVSPGTKVVALVMLPSRKVANVRFAVK
ncbi:hypothetical protein [Alicycliphilus denitrificans]|uniref:hypothetical protein n=1 Tax=Alicycliphilus denitrificans TaxID=179636 RepID=UPI00384B8D7F